MLADQRGYAPGDSRGAIASRGGHAYPNGRSKLEKEDPVCELAGSETMLGFGGARSARESLGLQPLLWQGAVASDLGILFLLALALLLLHTLTNGLYGSYRDELMTLDDARHLAWGYVVYPPVTPFLGRVELELFGTSLSGFRFFPAAAHAIAMVLTGLAARELGGNRSLIRVYQCSRRR